MEKNFYEILNVGKDATTAEITESWLNIERKETSEVNTYEAFKHLTNEYAREIHNQTLVELSSENRIEFYKAVDKLQLCKWEECAAILENLKLKAPSFKPIIKMQSQCQDGLIKTQLAYETLLSTFETDDNLTSEYYYLMSQYCLELDKLKEAEAYALEGLKKYKTADHIATLCALHSDYYMNKRKLEELLEANLYSFEKSTNYNTVDHMSSLSNAHSKGNQELTSNIRDIFNEYSNVTLLYPQSMSDKEILLLIGTGAWIYADLKREGISKYGNLLTDGAYGETNTVSKNAFIALIDRPADFHTLYSAIEIIESSFVNLNYELVLLNCNLLYTVSSAYRANEAHGVSVEMLDTIDTYTRELYDLYNDFDKIKNSDLVHEKIKIFVERKLSQYLSEKYPNTVELTNKLQEIKDELDTMQSEARELFNSINWIMENCPTFYNSFENLMNIMNSSFYDMMNGRGKFAPAGKSEAKKGSFIKRIIKVAIPTVIGWVLGTHVFNGTTMFFTIPGFIIGIVWQLTEN